MLIWTQLQKTYKDKPQGINLAILGDRTVVTRISSLSFICTFYFIFWEWALFLQPFKKLF